MKKAILYARMAVKDLSQKPNRLLLQLDELSVYCQDNDIQVEKMFADHGPGDSLDRTEFKKLLRGLKQGKIKADLLLFTTWDRFSRDLTSMKKMVRELEKVGVKPQSIKDKVNSQAIYNILKR
jgi:site-specific DNA recombinase